MSYRQRIIRLEEYRRKRLPPSHFLTIVRVPWPLPAGMDQLTWLEEQVMCACGLVGCPELRIGAILPEKASKEAWTEEAQQYYRRRAARDEL
jgi:hypothetical protein